MTSVTPGTLLTPNKEFWGPYVQSALVLEIETDGWITMLITMVEACTVSRRYMHVEQLNVLKQDNVFVVTQPQKTQTRSSLMKRGDG